MAISTSLGTIYYPAIKLNDGVATNDDAIIWSNDVYFSSYTYKASHFFSQRTGDVITGYEYHDITSADDPSFIVFNNGRITQRVYFTRQENNFYGYMETLTNGQWVRDQNPAFLEQPMAEGAPHFVLVYSDDGLFMFGSGISRIKEYALNDPPTSQSVSDVTEYFKPMSKTPGQIVGNGLTQINFSLGRGYKQRTFSIENSQLIKSISTEVTPTPEDPTDPYNRGGSTSGGGGTGTFSRTGDNISIPNLPTLSAVDAGFITLFNPTIAELRSLAAYMWSDAFSIETFKKIFANPMDCILGMSIVPVNVPNGASKEVKVGNIGTGVSMTTAASQYVSVDCGTLNVEEYWGAYLDYDPYTKAEIYLPYIGTHPVAIDDVMGKSVRVVYHIDILSGACIAFIQCGGTVIYSFAGQCASSIPITGNDWTNVINGVLQIAGAIGSMVATPSFSNITRNITNVASSVVSGSKPQVEKSGSLGGTGGMLGVQTPYLIITWPRQAVPYRQNAFKGYPSNVTASLGSLSGFTVVDSIHLENVPATGEELDEIMNLLRGGVIL